MRTRHFVFTLLLTLVASVGKASTDEVVVQVRPFSTDSCVTADSTFIVKMISAQKQQSFQFDMQLPQGMTIESIETATGISVPTTTSIDYNLVDEQENVYRIISWNRLPNSEMKTDSLNILKVHYNFHGGKTPANIQPIRVNSCILATKALEETDPDPSSSFFMMNVDEVTSAKFSNYSSLTGYVPSFTCAEIQKKAAYDVTMSSLLIQNADSLFSGFTPKNQNAMVYCKYGSKAYQKEQEKRPYNVVALDESEAGYSTNIYLWGQNADFADKTKVGNFEVLFNLRADTFALERNFLLGKYTSLYLPVSMSANVFKKTFTDNNIRVYALNASNVNGGYISCKEVLQIDANKPYFLHFEGDVDSIPGVKEIEVFATSDGTISADDATMHGSYLNTLLASTNTEVFYAFDSETGEYRRVGKNVQIYPFRSYVSVPLTAFEDYTETFEDAPYTLAARFINLNDPVTGIDSLTPSETQKSSETLYNIAGQKVSGNYKGIVIRNGRKEIAR